MTDERGTVGLTGYGKGVSEGTFSTEVTRCPVPITSI